MESVKIVAEGKYVDHGIKSNKSITLQFKMPYSELKNYVQAIQMLNENVDTIVKIGADKKPTKLGSFMINSINIDRDGEGKIKLNSLLDHVDANAINDLASRNDEPLKVMLKAEIDLEDEDDSDEEEENE